MARCLQILLYYGAKDRENARHETAQDMVKGKPRCEKILEQAATTMKTPINSTQEKEQQEKGKGGIRRRSGRVEDKGRRGGKVVCRRRRG